MQPLNRKPRVLDIGCSTGNLLVYLKNLIPNIELFGGDLMKPVIEECKNDPSLSGIDFSVMDVFNIPTKNRYDIIIANAVNVYFEPDEYKEALLSIGNALNSGGWFIAYEWVFPGDREQKIIETSTGHKEGLKFHFRSEDYVKKVTSEAGFTSTDVIPFDIPIDLPKPKITGNDEDLITYTVKDPQTNRRLMFRGSLYQPWAHIVTQKH